MNVKAAAELQAVINQINEGEATAMDYAVAVAAEQGRKFEAGDVGADDMLRMAAEEFLTVWAPNGSPIDSYMQDMQKAVKRWGSLSDGQAKGVLNVLVAQRRREAQKAAEVTKTQATLPKVSFSEQPQPQMPEIVSAQEDDLEPGYRTIVTLGEAKHITLRVRPHRSKEGVMVVGYMFGPDNVSSYKNFAYVRGRKVVWNLFKSQPDEHSNRVMRALDVLMQADKSGQKGYGEAYALWSKNCYVCGKLLTDPISISLGIGPICRGE